MATSDIQSLARALNQIQSAGAARAAGNAALRYMGPLTLQASSLSQFRHGIDGDVVKKRLRSMESDIERRMVALPQTPTFAIGAATWDPLRAAINKGVIEAAGVEGALGARPGVMDVAVIIGEAALAAPALALKQTTKAAKAIVTEAGKVAGSAVGGILSGLGLWSVVLLGGVAVYVWWRFLR